MAKYERRISGDFDLVLEKIKDGILEASASASLEDESRFSSEETMCAVQVYERYSAFGNNRVSLTVTLFKSSEEMIVSGIPYPAPSQETCPRGMLPGFRYTNPQSQLPLPAKRQVPRMPSKRFPDSAY